MQLIALSKSAVSPQKSGCLLTKKIWLIMKMTIVLLTIACLQLSAKGNAQSVTLTVKNASLEKVFKELKKQTGYDFWYESKLLDKAKRVKLEVKNVPLKQALDECFKGQPFDYSIVDKIIVIKLKPQMEFSAATPIAIEAIPPLLIEVHGTVTDDKGLPLSGATILVKGTSLGTKSDANGSFSINAEPNSILIISYVGFESTEIKVGNQPNIAVRLKPSVSVSDEVVVIGYGTVKKKDLTGSVSSIRSENIEKINTASLNDALQGMAAGVLVTSGSGQPGEGSNIVIRGGSSISASNEPLYVIDGFPQLGGSNMDLNPEDIESVEVLKDASAGAIYGARASNGVVIITTKSGKKGTLNITYNGRYTNSRIIRQLKTLDIVDYARVQATFAPDSMKYHYENPLSWLDSTSVNWQDAAYGNAVTQTHNLQINGGGQKTQYSSSLGYLKQNGIAAGSEYYRINSRLKIISNLNKKLKAGTNLMYSFDERDGASLSGEGNVGLYTLLARPYIIGSIGNDDLEAYIDPDFASGQTTTNPLKWLTEYQALRSNISLSTNSFLEYSPFKGLVLKTSGAMRYFAVKNKSYMPSDVSYGRNYNGIASISQSQSVSWLNENTADYKTTIGKHTIQGLAGFSVQSTVADMVSAKSTNFPIETLGADNIGFGTSPSNPVSDKWASSIASVFGRLNYTFSNRYLLTASLRADGSSNFGKNNKWGMFPSGAFAWRASEEKFIKNLNIFSDLKFRVSYGVTGNNSIGNYRSLMQFRTANISVNSRQDLGLIPGSMANEDLRWEQNKQTDVGIDVGLLNSRLNITADYYRKKSKDLLLNAPVPYYSGFTTYTSNIGDIQSSGYEFDIKGTMMDGKFKWTSSLNVSFPSTKVLRLSNADYFYTGNFDHKTGVFVVKVGDPLGSIYGYVFDGVNQNQDEVNNLPQFGGKGSIGGPRYKDISGPDGVPDGVIDSKYDRTIIGNGIPHWFGGFTNQFSYKNFDLFFLISFRHGNDVINANKNFLWRPGYLSGGLKQIMNAWTPQNPTNENWAWGTDGIEYNNMSSWLVEDGSLLRLKNITLGYNLPRTILKKAGIQNCKIFIAGDRLLTWTKYSGYDPEVSVSGSMLTPGVDQSNYPSTKSLTFGINLTF